MHPRLSGAILLDQIRVLEELTSKDTVQRAIAALDPADQTDLASLLPVSWCRLEIGESLFAEVAKNVGRETLDLHADVARVGIERTLKGLWRILLRLTTDDALIRRTPLFYSKTFDRGEMTSKMLEKAYAESRVLGWPAITPMQLQGIAIGIQTVLIIAGRKDVRVHRERTPNGALYHATWKP